VEVFESLETEVFLARAGAAEMNSVRATRANTLNFVGHLTFLLFYLPYRERQCPAGQTEDGKALEVIEGRISRGGDEMTVGGVSRCHRV